jgi:hypothetical protein
MLQHHNSRQMAKSILQPDNPAAPSVWLKHDFTDPTATMGDAWLPEDNAVPSAFASIGSPRDVPVPWRATNPIAEATMPASLTASLTRALWAGPLGAVKPLDRPPWLTAVPRTTATALAAALVAGARTVTTNASPRPYLVACHHHSTITQLIVTRQLDVHENI